MAKGVRKIGGKEHGIDIRPRTRDGPPPGRNAPEEEARGRAEEANGLRKASEAVAVVSAAVLVGGGAGMLAEIWLGAINPFALGLFGVAVGACVPALLARRPWRRGVREAPGG